MNDVLAGLIRFVVRLVLVAVGLVFFLSLLAAGLVLALAWSLRLAWARLTGRPATPWAARIDPRTAWNTVYRSGGRWGAGPSVHSAQDERPEVPAHRRPLPGAEDVTDVQPREPGGS